jgi:hypothetical protein
MPPHNTIYGGPLAPPFLPAAACPDIESALSAAVRAPSRPPLDVRVFGDHSPDGALALPANCSLRWLPPLEACALMPSMLLLVGDSLSRHLSFALRQVMSGNYAAGPLLGTVVPPDQPEHGLFFEPDFHPLCLCDEAYRICAHLHPPHSAARWASVCPAWATAPGAPSLLPPMHFLPWYGGFWNASAMARLLGAPAAGAAASAGLPRPVIVLEVGPGWGEGYVAGSPQVLEFLEAGFAAAAAAAAAPGSIGVRVVCYLTLAPRDALKPLEWQALQGEASTRRMNAWVARECRARGGRVLDAFALTLGTYTRDGTHYQGMQMTLVAQALLNLLAHFP